jgi:hypothetical protein
MDRIEQRAAPSIDLRGDQILAKVDLLRMGHRRRRSGHQRASVAPRPHTSPVRTASHDQGSTRAGPSQDATFGRLRSCRDLSVDQLPEGVNAS